MDFDLTIITTYISPIIVIACLVVGYVFKNLIPNNLVNNFIPVIVTVLGIVLNLWNCGWVLSLEVMITGAISGLASTGLHELFAQLMGIGEKIEGKHVAK